ncbi:MAG TPA: SRPBCC family protein, partial [Rhizobiaceae bacterium]
MLTVLKWLFYLIAAIALIIVGGSFLLPAQAVVTRSTEIAAPPDKVFAIVGDLRRFNDFSPWADLDPNIKYTFEGPESGIGQQMNWVSENEDVGSGSQRITRYEPPIFVETQLDFGMRGKPISSFDLVPSTTGTDVTWTFKADLNGIPAKWFGLFFDRWVGADYEKGLSKLKTVAEAESATPGPAAPAQAEPSQPGIAEPAAPDPATPEP